MKIQKSYDMVLLGEQNIDIEQENFNPKKSLVTMVLSQSKMDNIKWMPSEDDNEGWVTEKNHFLQV